jgi:2-isopropylmalate synthase
MGLYIIHLRVEGATLKACLPAGRGCPTISSCDKMPFSKEGPFMSRKIKIFDTTLRDGEQCPGASLNPEEKLEIAKQLAKLNVDVIEAGFAIASPGDLAAIQRIAKEVEGPIICSLARAKKQDIDKAYEAVKDAPRRRIHTFIATSPIHMEKKLRMTPAQVHETAVEMVKHAKSYVDDVEFSCEDAGRSEPEFLYKVIINIPDTVGYTSPEEFTNLVKGVVDNVSNISNADVSVHCHNDLGLAVANSLAAVKVGATQIECTINGIGERAGNCSLEEAVMAIKTRKSFYDAETNINTKEIYKTSRMVSNLTGLIVQPNKAIVGANAFAHEAGIHQAGMLRARETYEIMNPEDIGLTESQLVLGKHSGRNAFIKRLKDIGYDLEGEAIEKAFSSFKKLADKKKQITERDLESLVAEEVYSVPETYTFKSMKVTAGTKVKPSAAVELIYKGKTVKASVLGAGPVDAIYSAIRKLTKTKPKLVDYSIQAITGGTDALGEVTVRVTEMGRIFIGHGADIDILVASAKAFLAAINRLLHDKSTAKRKGLEKVL